LRRLILFILFFSCEQSASAQSALRDTAIWGEGFILPLPVRVDSIKPNRVRFITGRDTFYLTNVCLNTDTDDTMWPPYYPNLNYYGDTMPYFPYGNFNRDTDRLIPYYWMIYDILDSETQAGIRFDMRNTGLYKNEFPLLKTNYAFLYNTKPYEASEKDYYDYWIVLLVPRNNQRGKLYAFHSDDYFKSVSYTVVETTSIDYAAQQRCLKILKSMSN
jgi:hypothetical protein